MKKVVLHCISYILLVLLPFFCFSQDIAAVTVTKKGKVYEIRNGLLGLVIPSESAFDTSAPAPIQSFIYKDNVYSDTTWNILNAPTKPTSMKISFLVRTKDEVKVQIYYTFQKPLFVYRNQKFKGGEAGKGFYSFTLWLKKGEKSALFEEDSDYDIAYTVDITRGLNPDNARYRGWASDEKAYGYEDASGVRYRSEIERGYPMDATIELDYSKPFLYYWFKPWEPLGGEQNTGRYWQFFNSKANNNSNLIGYFQGRPSRLIGGRAIGVRLLVMPETKQSHQIPSASFRITMDRQGPDNTWYPHKRYQWGVFISTKNDLLSSEKIQPIALEMNKYSGLASVIQSYVNKPVKLIPAFYKGGIYSDEKNIQKICRQMKTDENLYKFYCEVDGIHKMIWDVWRYKDSAISIKKFLINFYDNLPNVYINGEGSYQGEFRYWKGTRMFKQYASVISALFADEQIKLTNEEKIKLEKLVGAMARIMWDDNNVPLFDSAGVNFGPANMYYMYSNGRSFFALLLAGDPEFSKRAKKVEATVRYDLETAIYKNGSSIGTPHYIQPTVDPILFTMLQLRQAGIADVFKGNQKIINFAKFYLTLLTPQSVRFMNYRKLISFGDGSEESAATFGLLAQGLQFIDSNLSNQLFYAFQHGPARGTTFGSVGLAVDLLNKGNNMKPAIETSTYRGYLSHFRNELNTDHETALWVLNGDSLFDHRNDDAGEFALYALGAPLSLSRSSFYYPYATDGRIRNVVIPEQQFLEWADSAQPITGRSLTNRLWPKSEQIEFASLGQSNAVLIKMSGNEDNSWYRKIVEVNSGNKLPLFFFYDSISGNGEKNIWSMMMMAAGGIKTPTENVIPERRISDFRGKHELPKGTKVTKINPGLNKFMFTGQLWINHPSRGIDWLFFTNNSNSQEISFAQWGTTWQNDIERNEFYAYNKVPYLEEQQIIRIKGGKTFFNILLPYFKGTSPYIDVTASTASPETVSINLGEEIVYLNRNYYYLKSSNRFIGALLSATSLLNTDGLLIKGGYTEVEYDLKVVKIRIGGNSGQRIIKLPFKVNLSSKFSNIKVESSAGETLLTIPYNAPVSENEKAGTKEYIFER